MKGKHMKTADLNWTADSCMIVRNVFVVQCVVDVVVAQQEFYSFLPETIGQWKFCFMDYIHEECHWIKWASRFVHEIFWNCLKLENVLFLVFLFFSLLLISFSFSVSHFKNNRPIYFQIFFFRQFISIAYGRNMNIFNMLFKQNTAKSNSDTCFLNECANNSDKISNFHFKYHFAEQQNSFMNDYYYDFEMNFCFPFWWHPDWMEWNWNPKHWMKILLEIFVSNYPYVFDGNGLSVNCL